MKPGYEYKGFRYDPVEDVEPEECVKIFHDVIRPDGTRTHIDWSPYSTPRELDFQRWVDIGCPDRVGPCSLDAGAIAIMWLEHQNGQKAV